MSAKFQPLTLEEHLAMLNISRGVYRRRLLALSGETSRGAVVERRELRLRLEGLNRDAAKLLKQ